LPGRAKIDEKKWVKYLAAAGKSGVADATALAGLFVVDHPAKVTEDQ